jgi:Ca2+-binding RTX toxin-like protein
MAQHRSGSDVLSGGDGSNVLNGGNGNDVIYGYGPEDRDPLSGSITATLVASGLPPAVFLQSSPADPDLLFVATLPGLIFVIDQSSGSPVVSPAPALALPFETGQQLLGFTFDPEFESNHRVYLDYSAADGTQVVSRFTMLDANTVDPSSEQVLLTIPYQPGAEVDRGGWLGFGPDGALYITTGDGAAPWNADPINGGVSQSPTSLMGKVLRIDVTIEPGAGAAYAIPADNPFANGEGGAPEVWALGLRNPFRASFDDAGNLYIGDPSLVSQEEVNVVSATASAPVNFGWPRYEGTTEFDSSVPLGPGTLTFPALEREAGFGPLQGRATIGGYVYDGPGGAQGLYFFGDFVAPRLFTAKIEDGAASEYTNRYDQLVFTGGDIGTGDLISFSTDALGRLYTTELDGEIHLLTPSAAAGDGADVLDGGNGQDQLFGGAGADRLLGGNGNDQLWGGLGSDNLEGGNGAGRLDGGYGADTLRGGNGTDTFILTRAAAASGIDTILDFQGLGRAGGDTLVLQGFSSTATISLVGVEDGTARYRIADDDQTYDVLLAGVGAAQLAASDYNFL